MRNRQFSLFFAVTIIAMVVSAVLPVSVRADDATPPPENTGSGDATPPPVDTGNSSATPPPASSAATQPSTETENTVANEADTGNEVDKSASVEVLITDAQGNVVSLASAEGENALLNGQPIWCPDGVTPDIGPEQCSTEFASISDLLSSLGQSSQQDGKIYIKTDTAAVAAVAELSSATALTDSNQESSPFGAGANAGVTLQNADVVVLDDQGNEVPALSQNGVDALLNGTSVWCPDGVTPDSGGDSCTTSVSGLGMMASILEADPPQENGTVYVQAALDSSSVQEDAAQPLEGISDTSLSVDPATNMTGIDVMVQEGDVMVLNDQGQETPLVDTVASNGALIHDPIWCPDTAVAPKPGFYGCTSSFTSLDLLVASLIITPPNAAGTIWIEELPDTSSSPIVIDGGLPATSIWSTFALTLQGGWSGIDDDPSITGNTTFNEPISIINWKNAVTLNDLTVLGATVGYGINVQTNGDIVLDNVTANGNKLGGAVLDNCLKVGSSCTGSGSVSVNGTNTFRDNLPPAVNPSIGLGITTKGNINLNDITAFQNAELSGIGIGVIAWTESGAITLTGTNLFAHNGGLGAVFTVNGGSGDIQLNNMNGSRSNTDTGVAVYNNGSGSVSILGSNRFVHNAGYGLLVSANGNIYAENLVTLDTGRLVPPLGGGVNLKTLNGSIVVTGINSLTDTNLGNALILQATGDIFVDGVTVVNVPLGDGIVISAGNDAVVTCSNFTSYSQYGVETGPSGGYAPLTLTLNDVTFSSPSAIGDYTINGGGTVVNIISNSTCSPSSQNGNPTIKNKIAQPLTSSSQPSTVNVINLNSSNFDSLYVLDCALFSATTLILPNGDSVTYACPITGKANLLRVENKDADLPAPLPAGNGFVSAMSTQLLGDHGPKAFVEGIVTISFVIPANMLDVNLSILYWDGSAWADLSTANFSDGRLVFDAGAKTADGNFMATTNFPGVFVLVKK